MMSCGSDPTPHGGSKPWSELLGRITYCSCASVCQLAGSVPGQHHGVNANLVESCKACTIECTVKVGNAKHTCQPGAGRFNGLKTWQS